MSTLLKFINTTRKRGFTWWLRYYWNHLLIMLYSKKVQKPNKDWVGIKVQSKIVPEGWTPENAFEFLGKEYSGIIMKGFMDKPIKK